MILSPETRKVMLSPERILKIFRQDGLALSAEHRMMNSKNWINIPDQGQGCYRGSVPCMMNSRSQVIIFF